MKLLFVIARLNKGGTAQYLNELTKGLQARGHQVLIATGFVQGEEIEDESADSLPLHRIESLGRKISPIKDLAARRELEKLVELYEPDLIYTHTFKAGLIGRTMKRRCPLIHAFHGHLLDEPEFQGWKKWIVILLERWLARRADRLVTVGERVARELVSVKVGSREKYVSIAPGVRPLKLANRQEVLNEFGLSDEKRPIVAWLARVTAVKGPARVYELAKRFPNALFIQAGGGDLLESISGKSLENYRIVGWQSAEKIWAIADIAISTSENEGMPVALIEAQLAAIPVVALSVGSVEEVVLNGETGYVVYNWGDEFFNRLAELIDSKSKRVDFGEAAKVSALNRFDPKLLVDNHEALFKEVLKR